MGRLPRKPTRIGKKDPRPRKEIRLKGMKITPVVFREKPPLPGNLFREIIVRARGLKLNMSDVGAIYRRLKISKSDALRYELDRLTYLNHLLPPN